MVLILQSLLGTLLLFLRINGPFGLDMAFSKILGRASPRLYQLDVT